MHTTHKYYEIYRYIQICTCRHYVHLCMPVYVTRSAKTQHNSTSLNLLYKALNTMRRLIFFTLYVVMIGDTRKNYSAIDYLIHGEHDGTIRNILLISYNHFSKHL